MCVSPYLKNTLFSVAMFGLTFWHECDITTRILLPRDSVKFIDAGRRKPIFDSVETRTEWHLPCKIGNGIYSDTLPR